MAGIIITVLLTILKIILILLLVILALVILVLVLPVTYEANACGDSRQGLDSLHAKVRVIALLGIVKVKACFKEGNLSYALKIFGKAFVSGKQEILKTKGTETADAGEPAIQETEAAGPVPEQPADAPQEAETADVPESVNEPAPEAGPEETETAPPAAEEKTENVPQTAETPASEDTVYAEVSMPGSSEQPSAAEMAKRRKKEEKERKKEAAADTEKQSVGEKLQPLIEKAQNVIAIVQDPATHRTARRIKAALFKILGHVLPRKCRIKAKFGTGDPAMTGQILGGLYALYPFYGDRGDFAFCGDFEQAMIDGKLYIGGRINPGYPAVHAAFLLRDKNIRKLIFKRNKKS